MELWEIAVLVVLVALVVAVIGLAITNRIRDKTIELLSARIDTLSAHIGHHDRHLDTHDTVLDANNDHFESLDALADMLRTRVEAAKVDHDDLDKEVREVRKIVSKG